ncbi:MAG: hypothetical protein KME19_17525 [Microcoleus vaginatus WJT46-NPBG5]|nr:hypothetical protein [Microcoleus vaginatus WJT46-NPBG5]
MKTVTRLSNTLLIISALVVCGVAQAWVITKIVPTFVARVDTRPIYE